MAVSLTLQIFNGSLHVGTREFNREIIKIGRLASAHLSLDDARVSRVHAVIQVAADGTISIVDMGSAEGTFVNGQRVSTRRLSPGDEIALGETRLVLELPAPKPVALPEPIAAVASVPPDAPLSRRRQPVTAQPDPHNNDDVEVRVFWGETLLSSVVRGRGAHIRLGSGATADLAVPEAFLPERQFTIVETFGAGHVSFRFSDAMEGELQPPGKPAVRLADLAASGLVAAEGGNYAVPLPNGSLAWASVGPLTVEVQRTPAPRRVVAPFGDAADFRFMNLALLLGFVTLAFLISAATYPLDADTIADDIVRNPRAVTKLFVVPLTKPPREKFPAGANAPKPISHPGHDGAQAGTDTARKPRSAAAARTKDPVRSNPLLQALAALGPASSVGVTSALNVLGNLVVADVGEARGFGGLGLRGKIGEGNTFTGNAGLGPFGTIGTRGRTIGYGDNLSFGTKKRDSRLDIVSETPTVTGCMDKELVRRVIHEHRNQVRYCYEGGLQRRAGLSGKVAVDFVIGAAGTVDKSSIDSSSLDDPRVEACIQGRVSQWLFPKPTCGGVAEIRYPFLLKESGE